MKSKLDRALVVPRLVLSSVVLLLAASSTAALAGKSVSQQALTADQPASRQLLAGKRQPLAGKTLAAAEAQAPTSVTKSNVPDIPAELGPTLDLRLGKASLLRLPQAVERISVGNPTIADVTMISPREVYILGKDLGTTNVIIWGAGGHTTIVDARVTADPALLEAELREMLPGETEIKVKTTADSLVLMGTVSDAVKSDYAVQIAQAWIRRLTRGLVAPITVGEGKGGTTVAVGGTQDTAATVASAGPRVVNMLSVRAPQQVMLEVKVAEVSKTLLDKLGVSIAKQNSFGGATYSLFSTSDFFNQLLGSARVAAGRD